LALCLDGLMFGSRFSIVDVINAARLQTVSEEGRKSCADILAYALHARSTDMRVPWEPKGVLSQLTSLGMLSHQNIQKTEGLDGGDAENKEGFLFNDRVMQVMIETGYLRELSEDPDAGQGCMSIEFAYLLRNLMLSQSSSTSLKASICRLIVSDKAIGHMGQSRLVADGLLDMMGSGTIFLRVYATAALVNLCQSLEAVKGHLMAKGIIDISSQALMSNDGDLMMYTFMLLVHLTKRSHFRLKMQSEGLVETVADIYVVTCKDINDRRRMLTEMCSVIGQYANDEDSRRLLIEKKQVHVKMIAMFQAAAKLPNKRKPGESIPEDMVKLLSKVMFTLRSFSQHHIKMKNEVKSMREEIGDKIIDTVVKDLQNQENCNRADWAGNAVLFIYAMSMSRPMTLKIDECGWSDARRALLASKMGQMDVFVQRIRTIQAAVVELKEEVGRPASPARNRGTVF